LRYRRAADLIEELFKETGSHTFASLRGYDWVASHADVATLTLSEWFVNVHRDRVRAPEPIRFPRPWPDVDAVPTVTPDELAELTEKLLARSALRDR